MLSMRLPWVYLGCLNSDDIRVEESNANAIPCFTTRNPGTSLTKYINDSLYLLVLNISTFFLSYEEKVKIQDRRFNLKMNY